MGKGKPTYSTALFDEKTFDLDAVYPRRSIVTPPGLLSRQPFTALYLVLIVPVILFVVPIVGALKYVYLRAFTRSCPPWSLLDFVVIYLVRLTTTLWWIPTHGGLRGIFHGELRDEQRTWRRRWIGKGAMPDVTPPYAHNKVIGPMHGWMEETGVRELKGSVPVWWTGKRAQYLRQPKAGKEERLLVYFTGGGYLISSCHPGTPLGGLPASVQAAFTEYGKKHAKAASNLPQSVVTVEYRKSGQAPTPAALIDCLALYDYVTNTLGFNPKNITLISDSAGGHLVNSVLRYLQYASIDLPDSAILICPWTDQAGTIIEHSHSSFQRNEPYDVLSDGFYHLCRDTFAMHFRNPHETLLDVYFSPCAILGKVSKNGKPIDKPQDEARIFSRWPKTFLIALKQDILFDQCTEMHRRLTMAKRDTDGIPEEALDVHARLFVADGPHDPFIAPPFAFPTVRQRALEDVCQWLVDCQEIG